MTTYGSTTATTTWVYDSTYGRLVEKNYNGESDNPVSNPAEADYLYSNAGRLVTRIWERGVSTTYGYTCGILSSVDYSDSTPDLTFTRDRLGRLRSVTQGGGSTANTHSYTYNDDSDEGGGSLGNGLGLYSEVVSYGGAGLSRTLYRHWDDHLRPSGWELKSGSSAEHAVSYGYDVAGRLNRVDPSYPLPISPAFAYGYEDGAYRLIHTVVGPVHSVTNTWESTHDVLDFKTNGKTLGTPSVISSYDYTLNQIGQRTATDVSGAAFGADERDRSWAYDSLGQLVVEDDSSNNSHDRAYSFDGIGNRISSTYSGGTIGYNSGTDTNAFADPALNQYYNITFPGACTLDPSYDGDGNMAAGPIPVDLSANADLTWDAENRLIGIHRADNNTTIDYSYDYLGRRIRKQVSDETPRYCIYDGWNLIAEYSGTALDKKFTWGKDMSGTIQESGGVGGLLAVEINSSEYYPTYDGNGNISEYLNENGDIEVHLEYDAFGNTIRCDELGSQQVDKFSHRFSSKVFDSESGLYYYGYRYYDPVTGRWSSRDPIGERGGENLFGFVDNNCVNSLDALGLIIATFDGSASYQEKIRKALEDMTGAKFSWTKYEKLKDVKCPKPGDDTAVDDEKKGEVYVLTLTSPGTVKNMWDRLRPIIEDKEMTVIAQQKIGEDEKKREILLPPDDTNACCIHRRVVITEAAKIYHNVETGRDSDDKIKYEKDKDPTPWDVNLWHELAGHYKNDHFGTDPLNDAKDNPTGKGEVRGGNRENRDYPPDVPIAIENEARQRWNKVHPDKKVRMRVPWYYNDGKPF